MAHIYDLTKRQTSDDPDDPGWWGYSETAYIVKWVVFCAIVLLLVVYFGGGYLHAQRRMKKGQAPLRYHAWLVPRHQRARFFPPQQNSHAFYRPNEYGYHGQAYPMQAQGPPPPAYNEPDYVPAYAPPEGGSKVNPDQSFTPPPGAPPRSNMGGPSNRDTANTSSHPPPLELYSPIR